MTNVLKNGFQLLILCLAALFLAPACQSAKKQIENGNYDSAIDHSIRKLKGKKKKKYEHVRNLELAFQKANQEDLTRINNLTAQNREENWERINTLYQDISDRQRKIKPLLPLRAKNGYRAKFDLLDVATLEYETRVKAADFLYAQAQTLLERGVKGDKQAARSAYYTIKDLERKYFNNYKDADKIKRSAREWGTSYVLFEVKNQSGKIMPSSFADRVLRVEANELNSEWKEFDTKEQAGMRYDYKATYKVKDIDISPERVHERSYTDETKIQDGFDYQLDKRGNVMKDSLGNDIKTPRYVFVRADVLEVHQSKAARIRGVIEIYDISRGQIAETRDVGAEILFEHYASTFRGDERALSNDSKRCIGNRPAPFPLDEDMLVQAADKIKPDIRENLKRSNAIF